MLPRIIFGEDYKIFRCKKCGCGATFPIPHLSDEYYSNTINYLNLSLHKKDEYINFANETLSVIDNIDFIPKSVLDVGCGAGYLLEQCYHRGYECTGIEPNHNLINFIDNKNLNIKNNTFDGFISNNIKKYDLIILSSVLEHIKNPGYIISESIKMLNDDGLILISQANFRGFLPRIFPWIWYGWQPREHFWHFSSSSFIQLGKMFNLDIKLLIVSSLRHAWYTDFNLKNLVGRNFGTFIARIGNYFGLGDNIFLIYSKRHDD